LAQDKKVSGSKPRASVLTPLALPWFSRYFPPAVAKVYIVSFRSHDDRRPSKFIVLADNMLAEFPLLRSLAFRLFTAPEREAELTTARLSFQGPPNGDHGCAAWRADHF
jgi:hypothetical protein